VFLAAIEKAVPPLTPQELLVYQFLGVAVLAVSLIVYLRLFRRLAMRGPQTRPDLMAMPELLAGTVIMLLFVAMLVTRWFPPATEASAAPENTMSLNKVLLVNMANLALPAIAIVILLIARGGHLQSVFGLHKVRLNKVVGYGFCLAVLAVPLTYAAKILTIRFTGSQEAPQALVQKYHSAIEGNDLGLIGLIVLSACVVAPLSEELLFRGTFYPLLSRGFGRFIAALVSAMLFAFVHDTYTDVPGLTILALCFTLAYEVTGSLLVPIFMHATFNSLSLFVMWWQIRNGFTP
jgi:uncharacterized protein